MNLFALILLVAFVGQAHSDLLVGKSIENEATFTTRRIIYKLDLNSIYPDKPVAMAFNISHYRARAYNFKSNFSVVLENDSVYFLSTVDRPATLKVNLYLNSTLKPTAGLQKYSKVFTVKADKVKKTHIFELNAHNRIQDILTSEKKLLEKFENNVTIAYIKPANQSYKIGIASTPKYADQLEESCFLGSIENLTVDKLDVNATEHCRTIAAPAVNANQTPQEFVVNVYLTIGTKPLATNRFLLPWILFSMIATGDDYSW